MTMLYHKTGFMVLPYSAYFLGTFGHVWDWSPPFSFCSKFTRVITSAKNPCPQRKKLEFKLEPCMLSTITQSYLKETLFMFGSFFAPPQADYCIKLARGVNINMNLSRDQRIK